MDLIVKICGITSPEDARAAAQAGADALGLMFFEGSPRHLPVPVAERVARVIPPHVIRAGVFVNPTEDLVLEAIRRCGLTVLQFHGEETPAFYRRFGLMVIKAVRMRDAGSLGELDNHPADAWLLDSHVPGSHGGTGIRFNWDLAAQAVRLGRPVFLAGGLTPGNVAEALREVRPLGVDVSSGVESTPGRKDPGRMSAFIRSARETARALEPLSTSQTDATDATGATAAAQLTRARLEARFSAGPQPPLPSSAPRS